MKTEVNVRGKFDKFIFKTGMIIIKIDKKKIIRLIKKTKTDRCIR